MWDARFESIKDRKLNELVIFAAMVRTDMARRHEYMEIMNQIYTDLDVIAALAEDRPLPDSRPITSTLYRSRLSKMELLDEYCLDQCRKAEQDQSDIRGTIISAAEEKAKIEAAAENPKVSAPEKIPTIEAPEAVSRIESPEDTQRIEAPEPIQTIEPVLETAKIDQPKEKQRLEAADTPASIEAAEKIEKIEAPEEQSKLDAPEEGAVDPDSTFDLIVSVEDAVLLKKVKEMKDSKIDYFIDAEMAGRFKEKACEDVISFLKTDIALIDMILSINITSKKDIETKIRSIVEFVENAEEPKHQKMYLNSLDYNEKETEAEYNKALKRLDEVITTRYSYVLNGSSSAFFQ